VLARAVRKIFDEAGFRDVKIIGSGGLDEYDLAGFSDAGVPYDSYGVGTRMGVSADQPWLDMAYKLVQQNGRPVLKLSSGKSYYPGRKQIFRLRDGGRKLKKDVIALRDETLPDGEPLLEKVMKDGKTLGAYPSLNDIRARFLAEFEQLDEKFRAIRNPAVYPVEISPRLMRLNEETSRRITQAELQPGARRASGQG
jgi:nicotinate phosphoribosyltransferase